MNEEQERAELLGKLSALHINADMLSDLRTASIQQLRVIVRSAVRSAEISANAGFTDAADEDAAAA